MNPNQEELLLRLALTKNIADRSAWLDRECGDDKDLRQRLEAQLAATDALCYPFRLVLHSSVSIAPRLSGCIRHSDFVLQIS